METDNPGAYRLLSATFLQSSQYSNIDFLFDVLENKRLYFDSFRNMNDPYEIFTFIRKKGSNETFVDRNVKDKIKITCFTKQYNNYIMWSHYGLKHQGVCISFDIPLEENKDIQTLKVGNDLIIFSPVLYKPIEISVTKKEFHSKIIKNGIEACRRKYSFWTYEEEYRAFIKSDSSKSFPKKRTIDCFQ